jgi:cyclophilin family peptidyl-prolyl cis-trans isomerase
MNHTHLSAAALCAFTALMLCSRSATAQLADTARAPVFRIDSADARAWERIAAAENHRAQTPSEVRVLLDGAAHASPAIRRVSVRAMGRMQRLQYAPAILRALHDTLPAVRATAAAAVAMAAIDAPDVRAIAALRDSVHARLVQESDPHVIGALLETTGRIRAADTMTARAAATDLASYAASASPIVRNGTARGLFFLARQSPYGRRAMDVAAPALRELATRRIGAGDRAAAQPTRERAAAALAAAGLGDPATALQLLTDPSPFVRRQALLMLSSFAADSAAARTIIDRGLQDSSWVVRYDALRQYGARRRGGDGCTRVRMFMHDPSMHVALQAIDLAARGCRDDARTIAMLDSAARSLARADDWHAPAHALVTLAAIDPAAANSMLPEFANSEITWVRQYAAKAATRLSDVALLERLANDADVNVRTAAVQGLAQTAGHAADALYLQQLQFDDSQLLMAAAAALDSTTEPTAADMLMSAFERVTRLQSENSRDGRMALLDAIAQIGDSTLAPRLLPALHDFDDRVAARAATVLTQWTRIPHQAAPQPLPELPMPSFEEVAALVDAVAHVELVDGTGFDLQLLPFDAPVNATRFAALARQGWFDGKTIHRVEPNFVVQGGSPRANEFAGAPRFSRDEIGYPNRRGTVGLSTRGHDTGDAQFYINTVDNAQLDPSYTVFGVVVGDGMSVVDRMLEGTTVRRIQIRLPN